MSDLGELVWLKDPEVAVLGTAEIMTGVALTQGAGVHEMTGQWDHAGGTEVNWDDQETKTVLGQPVFVLDGGKEVLAQEIGLRLADETVIPLIPEKDRKPLIRMCCAQCGGQNVKLDAWAEWNPQIQHWELGTTFDIAHCDDCDGQCSIEEREISAEDEDEAPPPPGKPHP